MQSCPTVSLLRASELLEVLALLGFFYHLETNEGQVNNEQRV